MLSVLPVLNQLSKFTGPTAELPGEQVPLLSESPRPQRNRRPDQHAKGQLQRREYCDISTRRRTK
jgi:hypothetical protein